MKIFCSKCNFQIHQDNINIEKDTCFCSNCNELFIISEILNYDDIQKTRDMLFNPPEGTWIKKGIKQLTIGVSTLSKTAFFLLIFCTLFSGISMLGFYQMIRDRSIFGIIFMTPFIIISIVIIWEFFYSIFGKIEIIFDINSKVQIFIGIGKIGKRDNINWEEIKRIFIFNSFDSEGGSKKELYIKLEKTIKIPIKFINEEKLNFLLLILKYYKGKTMNEILD